MLCVYVHLHASLCTCAVIRVCSKSPTCSDHTLCDICVCVCVFSVLPVSVVRCEIECLCSSAPPVLFPQILSSARHHLSLQHNLRLSISLPDSDLAIAHFTLLSPCSCHPPPPSFSSLSSLLFLPLSSLRSLPLIIPFFGAVLCN